MENEKSDIGILPPIIFVILMVLAFIVEWFLPLPLLPSLVQYALGFFIIAVSFLLIPSIFNKFRSAETTIDVRKIPTSLITDGAFAFSRNPIYVSMILLCAGVGVFFDNIWVFPAIIIAANTLVYKVIRREEAILEKEFGQEYLAYKRRVRRWL